MKSVLGLELFPVIFHYFRLCVFEVRCTRFKGLRVIFIIGKTTGWLRDFVLLRM